MDTTAVYKQVADHYSEASQLDAPAYGQSVAKAFGYSDGELNSIPTESNLGLSCGNPLAIASIKDGEVVIDLGSGAGFDVFLAANRVGSTGKAIGVDFNKDMLARAGKIKRDNSITNVEFIESPITNISVLSNAVADCIISNCVINLVPDAEKQDVFNEIFRLLKPGGRAALSDILAHRPLPDQIRQSAALYVGCIAGASMVAQYTSYLTIAGFSDVHVSKSDGDINVYKNTAADGKPNGAAGGNCCSGPCGSSTASEKSNFDDLDLNQWVGSYKIFAVKPVVHTP